MPGDVSLPERENPILYCKHCSRIHAKDQVSTLDQSVGTNHAKSLPKTQKTSIEFLCQESAISPVMADNSMPNLPKMKKPAKQGEKKF
ncbi:MAG: hypothetical protein KDA78_02285 [Planctomycetaceae bacterium]|nr:hypothetical protein [Planctomycetaceae bacterium]